MVHKKMRTNLRARMQVHSAAAMRPLGHYSRDQWDVLQIQLMGETLHRDRFDEWISDDDLFLAQSSRVAIEGGLGVGLQELADARQACQKFHGERVRTRA